MPSEVAKKVAGTFIADPGEPKTPVFAWLQSECRAGCFAHTVKAWCKEQAEPLDPALLIVDAISSNGIQGHVPCRIADHEATSTFLTEVAFVLNPKTSIVLRADL